MTIFRNPSAKHVWSASPRKGATVVEVAIVAPLTFLLLIGLLVGGAGTFRYQQLSWIAQEAAHWASVRGPQYKQRTGKPMPTANDVYQNAIKPISASFDQDQLQYSVERDEENTIVTVTLTYSWLPEAFGERIHMKSKVVKPITY